MEVDKRFSNISKDPRFKKVPKAERKVKIDSRFQKMFTDDRFHSKFSNDKRGKPIREVEKEDLHKFYEIDETEVEDKTEEGNEKETAEDKNKILNSKKVKRKDKTKISKTDKKGTVNKQTNSTEEVKTKKKLKKKIETTEKDINEPDNIDKVIIDDKNSKKKKLKSNINVDKEVLNFADIRGETIHEDSSSDENQEEDDASDIEINEEDLQEGIVHGWGNLDDEVKRIENAETHRLAICNCDWDKVDATDLYVLFNSFKPTGGIIKSVKIYPSEFGIERIKDEEINGPKELKETILGSDVDEDDEENIEGTKFHMEKLREYQLNRLKYYYAVVECDSLETANKLYEECDSLEYEMSSTRLDLRFIPNDTTFDHPPKSQADQMPDIKNYEPANFMNTALQQSTVRLTWDESDHKRMESTMKQFTKEDLENMDFKDYIASSSEDELDDKKPRLTSKIVASDDEDASENEDEEEIRIRKYRLLIQEIEAKEKNEEEDGENMEVEWNDVKTTKDEKSDNDGSGDNHDGDDSDVGNDDLISGDDDSNDDEKNEDNGGFDDPFFKDTKSTKKSTEKKEKKIRKKKKKNLQKEEVLDEEGQKKKNELELLLLDEAEDKKHFNLKDIMEQEKIKKSKKKRRKNKGTEVEEDTFKMDVDDNRFNALYTSHLYAIDPSEPHFKKTKATDAIIEETQRRRKDESKDTAKENNSKDENKEESIKNNSLSALVQSVKSKAQSHQVSRKRKKLK